MSNVPYDLLPRLIPRPCPEGGRVAARHYAYDCARETLRAHLQLDSPCERAPFVAALAGAISALAPWWGDLRWYGVLQQLDPRTQLGASLAMRLLYPRGLAGLEGPRESTIDEVDRLLLGQKGRR